MTKNEKILALVAALGLGGVGIVTINTETGEVSNPDSTPAVVDVMSCERATEVVNSILRSTIDRDLTAQEEAAYAVFQTCPAPMEPVVSKTIEVPKIPAYVTEWKACDTGPCKRRQIRKCANDTGKTKEECRDEVNK